MDLALLGYQHVLRYEPSFLPIVRLLTTLGGEWQKGGFDKSLKIVSEAFSFKLFLFFLIQLITLEHIISDPMISRLF
jgi:hypothetical protein